MFKYSKDKYIASKQIQREEEIIDGISKQFSTYHSTVLQNLFETSQVNSYSYLEGLCKLIRDCEDIMIMPTVPRNHNVGDAVKDFQLGFVALSASNRKKNLHKKIPIPYIKHSFPKSYKNPHGPNWMNIFIFLFTSFAKEQDNEKRIIYYINKFNKLKAFV